MISLISFEKRFDLKNMTASRRTKTPWPPARYPRFMRRTAEALGFLVMAWSLLEMEVSAQLMKLLRSEGLDARIYYELIGHIDFRDELQILKSMTFSLTDDDKWFAELQEIINHIDITRARERSRLCQDPWILDSPPTRMVRFGTTPRLRRPQSRQIALE